jgi:cytochrome b
MIFWRGWKWAVDARSSGLHEKVGYIVLRFLMAIVMSTMWISMTKRAADYSAMMIGWIVLGSVEDIRRASISSGAFGL